MRAVLSWSYRTLKPDEARALRLLGLHPGREFDAISTSVLVDTTPVRAGRLLDSLVRAHLLERTRTKRYQMHDLLRVYAADLALQEEPQEAQEAALRRLFDFFTYSASAAMDVLFPHEKARRPDIPPGSGALMEFVDEDHALRWLETERATLLAVAARTAQSSWAVYAILLSTILYRFLDIHGHFDEAVTLHTYAVASARSRGDAVSEGRALHNLGTVYQRQGRYQEAVDHLRKALEIILQADQPEVEAFVRSDLGLVLLLLGQYEPALRELGRALRLFEELDDLTGQGQVLNNMGLAFVRQNLLEEALDHMRRSLVLFRGTGDRPRQGYALNDIGAVYQRTGNHVEALDYHSEALAVARETGDKALEAAALNGLGNTNRLFALRESVLEFHEQALRIAEEIGDRYEQAQAHEGIAGVHDGLGRAEDARDHWRRALSIYVSLGSPDADRVRSSLGEVIDLP
ncbi:tetratricopeptide repeat protein [Thermocatellispora tengchongensis]|uniref:tetratricopeptide repeat protein n=1 Tax=Thermocatellispora tengchongensis TaxID=1073253 RepID=UPI00363296C5